MMNPIVKKVLVKLVIRVDKSGLPILGLKTIVPHNQTSATFEALQTIYAKCEQKGLKIWVAGSWAIAGIYGDFIKDTHDIDISTQTLKDEEKLSEILLFEGYSCKGSSPFGAIRFVNQASGVEVDIGSIQESKTAFKNVFLDEISFGEIDGFRFRILPKKDLLQIYSEIVFENGRNAKEDMKKIKVLIAK